MPSVIKWVRGLFIRYQRLHKTPLMLQMESTECVVVCLAIILAYYRLYIPQSEIRLRCGTTRNGTSLIDMMAAAEFYGMKAEGYEATLDNLHRMKLPAIISWGNDHVAVLENIYPGECVFINDPSTGPVKVPWEKVCKKYMGYAFNVEPGENFRPQGIPVPFWRKAVASIAPFAGYGVAIALALQVGIIALGLFPPFLMHVYVDDILVDHLFSWNRSLLVAFGAIVSLLSLFIFLKENRLIRFRAESALKIVSKLVYKLLHLPIPFFSARQESVIAVIPSRGSMINGDILEKIGIVFLNAGFSFLYIMVILYYNTAIGAIGIFAVILNLLLLKLVNQSRVSAYAERSHGLGIVGYEAYKMIANMENVRISASKNFLFGNLAGPQVLQLNALQRIATKEIWLYSLTTALQQMTMISLLLIGGWAAMFGELSIGILVGCQFLMIRFLEPMQTLTDIGGTIRNQEKLMIFLNDIMQQQIDPSFNLDSVVQDDKANEKIAPLLEFKNVTFGHSQLEAPPLKDLSFTVSPHNMIGIVGYSGSGKSTIGKLAAGFLSPWDGQIFYGNRPRQEYSNVKISRSVALVSQEIFIFEGSIYDNLTLWNREVPEDLVLNALERACILKEVLALNGGMYAHLKEGGINLSKGQRQRLMIARALLFNPTILILDEATSSLDYEIENEIMEGLFKEHRAMLLITHRYSVIMRCHEVLIIGDGAVIERGSPQDLMNAKGPFFELVNKQVCS